MVPYVSMQPETDEKLKNVLQQGSVVGLLYSTGSQLSCFLYVSFRSEERRVGTECVSTSLFLFVVA